MAEAFTLDPSAAGDAALKAFERSLGDDNLAPLWEVMRALAPREPRPVAVPHLWKWPRLRERVLTAGRLISAEKAERRVLVLENPALKGKSQITGSLYAGVQLILPGETAPSHRHTATALRLILEGQGAHTSVEGEKAMMHPGDFIITPSGAYHDHGNDGDEPVFWLDGLDVPIVNLFGAAFSDEHPSSRQPLERPDGDALARYGSGLTPVDYVRRGTACPLFCYPYARTREALHAMSRRGDFDPAYGLKVAYTDPTTGQSPIKTMGAYMQLLPRGFRGVPYRSTDGATFAVVEGSGRVRAGGQTSEQAFELARGDLFVIPGWIAHSFEATEDLVLFSFSDRPIQQHLGFWREDRAPA